MLQFTVSATDPDGDSLTYSASNLPEGATFNTGNRTFSWTPAAAGSYPGVRFEVSDGKLSDYEDITITVSAPQQPVEITKSITAGTDDGFSGSWGFFTTQSWYEAGNPGSPYSAWFRFTGITIPAGAVIEAARLETVHGQWTSGTRLRIRAEKAANPTAPTSTADHNSRVRTSAGADWQNGYADWSYHPTPDFSAVIQELVNSFDYSKGAAIQILVDNSSSSSGAEHVGSTFENSLPPRLYIRYR